MDETNIVLREEKCLKVDQRRKPRQMPCLCHEFRPRSDLQKWAIIRGASVCGRPRALLSFFERILERDQESWEQQPLRMEQGMVKSLSWDSITPVNTVLNSTHMLAASHLKKEKREPKCTAVGCKPHELAARGTRQPGAQKTLTSNSQRCEARFWVVPWQW